VHGQVFLYADTVSEAMEEAISETNRRREKQLAYNEEHGITPETIRKRVHEVIRGEQEVSEPTETVRLAPWEKELVQDDLKQELALLENEMWQASEELDFEKAANLREAIREREARLQGIDLKLPALPQAEGRGERR